MKNVFEKLELKANAILQNVFFKKNGKEFSSKEKEEIPVEQIANNYEKEENSMTILVNDLERNSLSNENLGEILPQNEDNDPNYNNNGNNNSL